MNSSKALGAVFLAAAIGWCGFSTAQLIYPKLPMDGASLQEVAIVAMASATENRGSYLTSLAAPPLELTGSAISSDDEPLPDPVAAGPADIGESPVAATAAQTNSESKRDVMPRL